MPTSHGFVAIYSSHLSQPCQTSNQVLCSLGILESSLLGRGRPQVELDGAYLTVDALEPEWGLGKW